MKNKNIKKIIKKKKLAIFDFTDCEGCQIELISLGKQLLNLLPYIEIVNWRLGQDRKDDGPYDVALVEGCPIQQEEIDWLKDIREKSKVLISLGTCATTGGVPAIMDKEKRAYWYKKIYGEKYKPRGIDATPLSAHVKIDVLICGCPINGAETAHILMDLLNGKAWRGRGYSVCFECKKAQNPCLLVNKEPCLGPITQGGCGAICISGDSSCYGCFGIRKDANIDEMINILKEFCDDEQIEQYFSMFLKRTEAYQKAILKVKKSEKKKIS